MDRPDNLLQFKIGSKKNSSNNNSIGPSTSDYLPQLHLLPLKRDKNLRTYSRIPKKREIVVSATSEVNFSKKRTALDYKTNVICTSNFKDCRQDKIMQCTDIAVKFKNNELDDCISITDGTIRENVLSLQDEIIKEAEEIIELSCSEKYDNDMLNFAREQLYQVLQVLKSAKQIS